MSLSTQDTSGRDKQRSPLWERLVGAIAGAVLGFVVGLIVGVILAISAISLWMLFLGPLLGVMLGVTLGVICPKWIIDRLDTLSIFGKPLWGWLD